MATKKTLPSASNAMKSAAPVVKSQQQQSPTKVSSQQSPTKVSSSSSSSSSKQQLQTIKEEEEYDDEEYEDDDGEYDDEDEMDMTAYHQSDYDLAYIKFDFTSNVNVVEVYIRVITLASKLAPKEIEEADLFEFVRKNGHVDVEDMFDMLGFIVDTNTGMPEGYLDNVMAIVNAMIDDPNNYEDGDIRLLWDKFPDGQPPAVEPIELTGNLKIAVEEFVSQPNITYR